MNFPSDIRAVRNAPAPLRKETTVDDFKSIVMDWAKEKIAANIEFVTDKLFQELFAMNPQSRYGLFHGLCHDTDFPGIIGLYQQLAGALYDDGDISFVRARVQDRHRRPDGSSALVFTMDEYFVMNGDCNELIPERVNKVAIKHHGSRSRVVSFRACRFTIGLFEAEAKRAAFMQDTPMNQYHDRSEQADRYYDRYIAQTGYKLYYI